MAPVHGLIWSDAHGDDLFGRTFRSLVLGVAGHALVRWLSTVLSIMSPTPPPAGADLHLRLDLCAREIAQLQD